MSSIGENYPQFWLFPQWVILSGECVISLVLSRCSKDLKQWTSVTALLQFSFIWQVKDSTSLRHEGGPTQKGRLNLGSSFYMFCLLPMNLPCVNWDSQEGCLFHLKLSVQFVEFLLYHFHGLFPFFVFSVQFCSAQSRPPLCIPMDCSTPGFPVHHQLPEPTQTHVHRVGDIPTLFLTRTGFAFSVSALMMFS